MPPPPPPLLPHTDPSKSLISCDSFLQAEHDACVIEDEEALADFLETMQNAAKVRLEVQEQTHHYKHAVPFLQPGRIVQLKSHIAGAYPSAQIALGSVAHICVGV